MWVVQNKSMNAQRPAALSPCWKAVVIGFTMRSWMSASVALPTDNMNFAKLQLLD